MITLSTEGKTIDTGPAARLITEGEKNADVIRIEMPASYGTLDLTALTWVLGRSDRPGDAGGTGAGQGYLRRADAAMDGHRGLGGGSGQDAAGAFRHFGGRRSGDQVYRKADRGASGGGNIRPPAP